MSTGGVAIARPARPFFFLGLLLAALLAGCGGGGSGSAPASSVSIPVANTLAITVDRGPDGT